MIRSWAVNPRRTIGAIVISAFVATMALGDAFGAETGNVPSSADASAAGSISPDIPIRERVGLATETDRYVRAAIGAERARATRFMDKDCANDGGEFVPLYGCGTGFDGKPLSSSGNFDTMRSFELAAGYIAAPFLRIEALVQRRASSSFKGHANFSQLDKNSRRDVHVDVSSVSVMFATYVDLPELGVPGIGPLSPFVGAGVGHSRIKTSETRQEFRCTTNHSSRWNEHQFCMDGNGWRLGPGVRQGYARYVLAAHGSRSGRNRPRSWGRVLAQQYPGLHGETSHPSETLRVTGGTGQPRSLDFPAIRILIAAAPGCYSRNTPGNEQTPPRSALQFEWRDRQPRMAGTSPRHGIGAVAPQAALRSNGQRPGLCRQLPLWRFPSHSTILLARQRFSCRPLRAGSIGRNFIPVAHEYSFSVQQLVGFRAAAVRESSCLAQHLTLEGFRLQRWRLGDDREGVVWLAWHSDFIAGQVSGVPEHGSALC